MSTAPATPLPSRGGISGLPDPLGLKNNSHAEVSTKKAPKIKRDDPSTLYKGPGGCELPKEMLQQLSQFSRKRKDAVIDVWWLYDDGGLTLLLPYIISTRQAWNSCKLR